MSFESDCDKAIGMIKHISTIIGSQYLPGIKEIVSTLEEAKQLEKENHVIARCRQHFNEAKACIEILRSNTNLLLPATALRIIDLIYALCGTLELGSAADTQTPQDFPASMSGVATQILASEAKPSENAPDLNKPREAISTKFLEMPFPGDTLKRLIDFRSELRDHGLKFEFRLTSI